jgi:uncharacterized protein with HEPN domain
MHFKLKSTLVDIRENILFAQQIVEGVTFDNFETSRISFYAATRCLEIVSEATRRLPKELIDRHPDIPWRRMKDAGNFYRHQYGNVAEERVWNTIHDYLPPLLALVIAELDEQSDP